MQTQVEYSKYVYPACYEYVCCIVKVHTYHTAVVEYVASGHRHTGMHGFALRYVGMQVFTNRRI